MRDLPGPMQTRIDEILADHSQLEGPLLPILHAVQAEWDHIPEGVLGPIASALNISRAELHGVITFYHDFRREPAPAHVVKLCRAEACQAQGSRSLEAEVQGACAHRKDIAVEAVYCLGLCACGPAAMVDGQLIGRADATKVMAKVRA